VTQREIVPHYGSGFFPVPGEVFPGHTSPYLVEPTPGRIKISEIVFQTGIEYLKPVQQILQPDLELGGIHLFHGSLLTSPEILVQRPLASP
jgi:hypothetical protein